MSAQPEALRLADALTTPPDCTCRATSYFECGCDAIWPEQWIDHAAAELRRLHAENQELQGEVAELRAWLEVETGRVKQAVAAEHQARQRVINGLKLLHDSFSMASKENKA